MTSPLRRYGFKLLAVLGLLLAGWLVYDSITGFGVHRDTSRPESVSASAVWIGGPEGGQWVDCTPKDKALPSYHCVIRYKKGAVWAEGDYVLRAYHWSQDGDGVAYEPITAPDSLPYDTFDGTGIFLKESRVLLPDGEIDYPLGEGHGKKQRYELGTPVGTELPYGTPPS